MKTLPATADVLDSVTESVLPHLERFAHETLLASAEDILEDCREGFKQLWLVADSSEVVGVAVTTLYDTLKGRVCCIWAACGTVGVSELNSAFMDIECWARELGCSAIEVRGRKGWARTLQGFKETGVLLEKDLRQVH